ncbi:MAG: hypothetical protein K8I00_12035 [Candidatus Omnitrophica bacterium]|nr:hypothetical protein [Candidatus Omnitrophota bacterium]
MFEAENTRMTKEDWDFILMLRNLDVPREIKQKALYERMLPRLKATLESDELLECEKEENLLTFDEYKQFYDD